MWSNRGLAYARGTAVSTPVKRPPRPGWAALTGRAAGVRCPAQPKPSASSSRRSPGAKFPLSADDADVL